ncbi:MAG: hypothetical protein C0467_28700 [Planctomycetaceae bacterium]|nr:hypothetical protein [Planctomycetaceae bacterium]
MSPDTLAIPPVDLDTFIARLAERLTPPAELLSRETLATMLDIGASTFDRLRAANQIGPKPIRLGGALRWHRQEVTAWLAHRDQAGELHTAETWPAVWASIQRKSAAR